MIAWDNLWKWQVYAGWHGKIPRTLLTIWEFLLWGIVGVGVFAGCLVVRHEALWLFGLMALLGGLAAGAVAFFSHELFFQAWVVKVAGVPVADTGDIVGSTRGAVAELERWTGPVK